ncbi:unnamed protein product, partial [Polarella glacialis]
SIWSLPLQGTGRIEVPGTVFQYALRHGSSWACWVAASFGAAGAPSAQLSGVGPGAPLVVSWRWRRDAVWPALVSSLTSALPGISPLCCQFVCLLGCSTSALLQTAVHNRRMPATDARLWGLVRCGHHVFADGRVSRHLGASSRCLLRVAPDGSLNHELTSCPACHDLRVLWCRRNGASLRDVVLLVAETWIFNLLGVANSPTAVAAHIAFVAMACRRGEDALRDSRAARR